MNEENAMKYCKMLAKECSIKNMSGIKQPEPRLLEDFGIDDEGHCIYCEGYRSEQSKIQGCVRTFANKYRLDLNEQGNDIIIK